MQSTAAPAAYFTSTGGSKRKQQGRTIFWIAYTRSYLSTHNFSIPKPTRSENWGAARSPSKTIFRFAKNWVTLAEQPVNSCLGSRMCLLLSVAS